MSYLKQNLLYDWPAHFILLLTNWLPDNVLFLRLRGALLRPFFGSCGSNLLVERDVVFRYPSNIYLGKNVFIGHGCCFLASTKIYLADEVMFGPYCVVAAGNHTRFQESFRFGSLNTKAISIGKGTWIASHVAITPGSAIGDGCGIAAGAVVSGIISSHILAGGVPARQIRLYSND